MILYKSLGELVRTLKTSNFIQHAGDHYTLGQCLKILKTNHNAPHQHLEILKTNQRSITIMHHK